MLLTPPHPPVAYLELWHWCVHGCVTSLSLSGIRLYTCLGTGKCVLECVYLALLSASFHIKRLEEACWSVPVCFQGF